MRLLSLGADQNSKAETETEINPVLFFKYLMIHFGKKGHFTNLAITQHPDKTVQTVKYRLHLKQV